MGEKCVYTTTEILDREIKCDQEREAEVSDLCYSVSYSKWDEWKIPVALGNQGEFEWTALVDICSFVVMYLAMLIFT